MRKLSNLFMTLSVLCFALPAFAQAGGARESKCPERVGQAETFTASRLTQDNSWFPTRIVVSPLRVSRVKSSWFSNDVESIAMTKVASFHIYSGVLWSEIVIESTGGAEPLIIQGLSNADAKRIGHLIALYQQGEEECRVMDRATR
jgi:hypothetical protein